jgi:uncharacterized protein
MWIQRDVEARLRRSARTRPVVVLTGARQTGKTSTLRRLFPDHAFVSLDLPTEAEQAEKAPLAFLRRHAAPVILDEVQYAPALFRHLKIVVDAERRRNGRFLLTGSQKFTLMKGVSESLAGRVDLIELETLSFAEIHAALPRTDVETAIVHGGFPELHANPDIDAVAFYNSYLATYLERDVRALANVGSLRDFERFLRACALRSANLLNRADLARDVGIAPSTANQWLSVAVGAAGVGAGGSAGAVVFQPHQVDRQEPQALRGGYRCAVRPAQRRLDRCAAPIAGGRRDLGDVRLRATATSRTTGGADRQPLLLARPQP